LPVALTDEHAAYLSRRGITDPQIIAERGYHSVLGGLAMPVHALPDGTTVTVETRWDIPRGEKKFTRPAGAGNVLNVLPSAIARVLDPEEPLWVVEGATRADALAQRGQAATSIMGCWGWKSGEGVITDFHELPRAGGRTLIFGVDGDFTTNPDVNRAVRDFSQRMKSRGYNVSVVTMPDGMGIDDYLAQGYSVGSILSTRLTPAADIAVVKKQTKDKAHLGATDVELAKRWAEEHPHARYLVDSGLWTVFVGGVWATDTRTRALARASVLDTFDNVLSEQKEPEEHAKLKAYLYSANATQSVVSAAESHRAVHATEQDFADVNPWLLNLDNGVLDLRTHELLAHAPEYLQRAKSLVSWDDTAECPKWVAYLDKIQPKIEPSENNPLGWDGPAVQEYLQTLFGVTLVGESLVRDFPILVGEKRNGKTTMLEVFHELLGTGYSTRIDKSLLFSSRNEKHQTFLNELRGRRFAFSTESGANEQLRADSVKELAGGDTLTAGKMRQDPTPFRPSHSIWLATNNLPVVDGQDEALWDRVRVVPFHVIISERDRNPNLRNELLEERSGILRWALAGLDRFVQAGGRGVVPPEDVVDATQKYRNSYDPFGSFATERLILSPDASESRTALHKAFVDWLLDNGLSPSTFPAPQFYTLLERWGGLRLSQRAVGKSRTRSFVGVCLSQGGDSEVEKVVAESSSEQGERFEHLLTYNRQEKIEAVEKNSEAAQTGKPVQSVHPVRPAAEVPGPDDLPPPVRDWNSITVSYPTEGGYTL
jgi:P4 family phage/plasmid primase-like protien